MRTTPTSRWLARLWPVTLALLVMAPLLAPGYVLSYDMVFVPEQAIRSDYFGLGAGLPRAVPSDALVSVAGVLVPGSVLQKAILVAIVLVGGAGVLALVPGHRPVARVAAVSWFVWNPFFAERLLIGQWVVLLAYAAMPWVLLSALRARQGSARATGALVLALGLGALSASGGVMTALLGLTVLLWPGCAASVRRRLLVVAAAVAVNLPWIVPGLFDRDALALDEHGVAAFAAAGDGVLPTIATVLGLGGIWNADTVPASRDGLIPLLWLVVLLAAVLSGLRPLSAVLGRPVTHALLAVAGVSLALSLVGVLDPSLLALLTEHVPGAGLLRDGTRYLGGLALLQALAFGCGVERWCGALGAPAARRLLAVGLIVAPLAVMPDLAWGAAGGLRPVDYPRTWTEARAAMVADGGDGRVLVLPLSPYRSFDWNDRRPVLDPVPRYFPNDMLASDALRVDDEVIQPETQQTEEAYHALLAGDADALRRLGVGYVVQDTREEVAEPTADLAAVGATALYVADDIAVHRLTEPSDPRPHRGEQGAVVVAWSAAGITLGLGFGTFLGGSRVSRRRMS